MDNPLCFFAKYIENELGIVYSPDNYFQLQNRLEEIVRYFQFSGIEELHQKVLVGPPADLRQLLLDTATNNETSFFRDGKPFQALREVVLPNLAKKGSVIRIWSAASSTGQEAYSLAILVEEMKPFLPGLKVEILATDISRRVVDRVSRGLYSQLEVQRGLPTPLLLKYFKQVGDQWQINADIKSYVKTGVVNLCGNFTNLGPFDVIFCRNVLIYQRLERKAEIVRGLARCLSSEGYLVMGAGESMMGVSQDFDQHDVGAILYRMKGKSAA